MISYHIYRKVTNHKIVKKTSPKVKHGAVHTFFVCIDGSVFEAIKHIITGRLL